MEETTITPKKIKIARTRSGIPCLWESCTKFDDIVRATIILNGQKQPKKAYYYNTEREKQALVGIAVGDYMVKCFSDAHGIAISIFIIDEISAMDNLATISPVYRKSSLVQEEVYPPEYADAIHQCSQKLAGIGPIIISLRDELEAAI